MIRPYQVLPLRDRVDLGAMAMKEYFVFLKAPAIPQPHHQMKGNRNIHVWIGKKKQQQHRKLIIQAEEINRKYWLRKRDSKDTESHNKNKTEHSKIMKEDSLWWRKHKGKGATVTKSSEANYEKAASKAKYLNKMKDELQRTEEVQQAGIHMETLRKTLKNIHSWKTLDHNVMYGFWF